MYKTSKSKLENLCIEDSNCKAIDYTDVNNWGHLCTTVEFGKFESTHGYEACTKTGTAVISISILNVFY